jgi:hypothetical protein
MGVAWSCTGAHGGGPVSRECSGETSCALEGTLREEGADWGKGEGGGREIRTDLLLMDWSFAWGACWGWGSAISGEHGRRHYPVCRRNRCLGGSLAVVRAGYGHCKRDEVGTYQGMGGPEAAS